MNSQDNEVDQELGTTSDEQNSSNSSNIRRPVFFLFYELNYQIADYYEVPVGSLVMGGAEGQESLTVLGCNPMGFALFLLIFFTKQLGVATF